MTTMTERRYAGEHIISEGNRSISREEVIIAASQTLLAGRVLGKISVGALSAVGSAVAGNAGAQTITAGPPVAAGTPVGDYDLLCISAGATAKFLMTKPGGEPLGIVTTGTPATLGGIGPFTIADPGTDPAVGDRMNIAVAAAAHADNGKYVAHDPTATNGAQHFAGILFDAVTTGVGQTAKAVVHKRLTEVNADLLAWGAHTTDQKNAALAEAALVHVIAR